MDQGRQRCDQVDAAVMPDVRRQRGPAPASCARLQSRQLPAHAGDTRADQGLVADEPEGEADQDRREGRQPRPLRRIPDGRGRYPPANVRGDFAAHRRTTAAASARASMRRSWSCAHEQSTGGMRPDASENSQISCSTIVRAAAAAASHPHLASVLMQGRKSPNICVSLESSGESRLTRYLVSQPIRLETLWLFILQRKSYVCVNSARPHAPDGHRHLRGSPADRPLNVSCPISSLPLSSRGQLVMPSRSRYARKRSILNVQLPAESRT